METHLAPASGRSLSVPALVLGLALSALTACDGLLGPEGFTEVGTVRFLAIEGGCWSVETASERYEPVDLPERFRQDGLRVRFEAEVRDDLASVCQIGPLIELREIELR